MIRTVHIFPCTNIIKVSSACHHYEDDVLKYIKPTADGGVIPVICSNGFTMIDIRLNKDAIADYFSSFQEFNALYEDEEVLAYGPGCSDYSSWRDFWSPATVNTKFRVANYCKKCMTSTLSMYDENVAYYMTNYYFDLGKSGLAANTCTRDETTNEPIDYTFNMDDRSTSMCNVCDLDYYGNRDSEEWSECPGLQLGADTVGNHYDHETTLQEIYMLVQPSVAGDRSYCTCYQPLKREITSYLVDESELPKVAIGYRRHSASWTVDTNIIWETESDSDDCSAKYYLSSADFRDGTLKITVCGEYILTEDIGISFNAPSDEVQARDDFSPNSIDVEDLYWYPTTAQQDSDEYPGLDTFHGIYQFGFFAGISIQTDDVTINLNGFIIKMEMKYYLQQRFFAIIELGNRNFILDEGPMLDLGKIFTDVSNIVIKDGTIGRSSHHGIHGNRATNVRISNVKIKNFNVAGLQLNGCSDVEIDHVVVGPQSSGIPVLGRYVHGRGLLPRLRYMVDLYPDELIAFGDNNPHKESKTVSELADDIITQMDLIYFYIIDGVAHDIDNEDWIAAKSLFLNKNGWLDAASAYGIIINGAGTAVTTFGRQQVYATNVALTNVEIHGISVSTKERFWSRIPGHTHRLRGFFFDPIDWISITADDGRYVGDAYTDIVIAANELIKDEFCFLNTVYLPEVSDWVFDGTQTLDVEHIGGSDVQSHVAKGAMGLRVDKTEGFSVKNLYIHDITNYGALGDTDCCGEWDVISFISKVYIDIEPGYTGTRAHGVLLNFMDGSLIDVTVQNIESHYGSAVGMSLYKGSAISILRNVEISNVNAGTKLNARQGNALTLPNMVPFACSVEFGPDTEEESKYPISVDQMNEHSIVGRNIYGHAVCEDDQLIGSIVNDVQTRARHSGSDVTYGQYLLSLPIHEYYGWISILFVILFSLVMIYYYKWCGMHTRAKEKYESYGAVDFHADI